MFVMLPASPAVNSAFDLTTLTFISLLIILSVLSLCFIFHLRFKSKSLKHLKNFNSLWSVRFLLVIFIFLWSLTELFRIPFFRRRYLYPFLPSAVPVSRQAALCKLNLALSLGFFEPAFLVTLLFLLNASIVTTANNQYLWTNVHVIVTCLPIAAVQLVLTFFNPLENRLSILFCQSFVVVTDGFGSDAVLCAYPLLNSIVFAAFGLSYSAWFLFSCWRVLSLVINKGLRVRIYGLAAAVLVALPMQVVALSFTVFWRPEKEAYGVISLVVFLGAFVCAATGEGVMVIKPISDALEAGGSCRRWGPRDGESGEKELTVVASAPEKVAGGHESV